MKKTQNIMMAAALVCALATRASATEYGQPVREVEKEARNGVTGYCESHYSASNHRMTPCELASAPAGKVLAVRWVSSFCSSKSGEAAFALGSLFNGYAQTIWFPLQSVSSPAVLSARAVKIVSAPVWMNAKAGTKVYFEPMLTDTPSVGSDPFCAIYYGGFLLDS